VVGTATDDEVLVLEDPQFVDGTERALPTVADKTFLITIGDRSVTGMVARDQMVGPWQVPVADVAVTTSAYTGNSGEAMSMGERTPLASVNAPASGRMAIGEALTNLAAANIRSLSEVKLSANWMAAAGHSGDDAALYETVKAVGMELCPDLGIAIPVGKDSMSMKSVWQDESGNERSVTAPVSCVISAFAPVDDTNKTLTPALDTSSASNLLLIDFASGQERLACSALAQVYNQVGSQTPDVDNPSVLKNGFLAVQELIEQGLISAYHDRSDGGLISTVLEMAFASRCGLALSIDSDDALATLFNEELGAVIQVLTSNQAKVDQVLTKYGFDAIKLGSPVAGEGIQIIVNNELVLDRSRVDLHRIWSETSYQMQKMRDNPECAQQEFDRLLDTQDRGLFSQLSFDPKDNVVAPYIGGTQPKIAILREQGVNGHIEMAAAFSQSGFSAIDVTIVLGAGEGWAKSILFNAKVRDAFQAYFERQDAFALGICNGCQMMSNLKEIIPGAEHWPHFVRNASEQFEARLVQSKISDKTNSILLNGMQGSTMPVVVAHGEGRAEYGSTGIDTSTLALSYVDYQGEATEMYPANPNGSPQGIAGLSNADGRVTIMMPHPERIFRSATNSWRDDSWGEYGPWMRMFRNARVWVD